ncbi:FAD-dependent oxidoreductase [Candidatus Uabimicrobium sp. HlEnr_7]|uniref:FAD-dependent oxidoreductase n=1 Tax=Candidatus Uabimicrobium helgolandensis TaxID=3095367 RepID=UPI003555D254
MRKVTIIGAGLVGSLLATYLGKRGIKVDLYERRGDMRKEQVDAGRSINLACSTRGWKALNGVGLEEEVKEAAIAMHGRMMHSISGDLTFQPYGKEGEAIYSISRAHLNKILLDEVEKNSKIHFDHKCIDLDLENATVTFQNEQTKQQTSCTSDIIFGADGAFSAVRETMRKKLRFNYQQQYIEHGYKELTIPPTTDGEWALEKNFLHIWPRKQYMLIALPNTDGSFTCTLFLAFRGEKSFENLQTPQQVSKFFEESFPDIIPLAPNLLDEFFANPTSGLVTISCSPWQYQEKIALIGDAAHAIVPFYGQGMVSGFEDVRILNDLLDEFPNQSILQKYTNARQENGDAIAALALQNFIEMRDLVGDPSFLLRKRIEARIQNLYPGKYIPLYSMVTFSHLPYKEALSVGKKQKKMLDEILQISNIENIWQTEKFLEIIHKFITVYQNDVFVRK